MSEPNWIKPLFAAIDAKDTEKFSSFLAESCTFRFANLPEITGAKAISQFVAGFFASIDSLNHEITDSWDIPGAVFCHGMVSYRRHDQSVLTVPFSNIFKTGNGKVQEYLIFADTSQLYTE